jgi:hypothetical protein
VPVGDVLVCDAGGKIEHDDTALSVDAKEVEWREGMVVSRQILSS